MKYTDCETCMSSALLGAVLSRDEEKKQVRPRVIWEGEYAGFTFQTIVYGRKDAPKFVEVCIDKDCVEHGWCDLDEDGYDGMSYEGFPFAEGFELPDGMTEKGLDDFFQTQPTNEAFRRLYQDGRIFLADIQEGLEARLKDAKDEDDRKEAERECDRTRAMEGLDNYRMLKERMDSDECGWGANWWED